MIELSITVKDSSKTFVDKDIVYECVVLDREDPSLQERVKRAVSLFPGELDLESPDIVVRAKMVW